MEKNIPQQKEGGHSDTTSSVELQNLSEAKNHFETVKSRFLNVNSWGEIAGNATAEFALFDANNQKITRNPQIGDYFRINIPGPDNETGDKYDWVQVEHTEHKSENEDEIYLIRVRPCANPFDNNQETAHFFDEKATSTFLIYRENCKIFAEVHGRNEKPNTENLGIIEQIRNTVVAIGGIILGSKFQWKSLTNGLVKLEN